MHLTPHPLALAQIIHAPSRPSPPSPQTPNLPFLSIFLAGTTTASVTNSDWRNTLSTALSHLPVAIFNPLRPDWDSTWREDVSFPPFREQVEWELDMQARADVVAVWFGAETDAPVSLLELGLCVGRRGKTVVVGCHRGYRKRGNVEIVCGRMGVECLVVGEGEGKMGMEGFIGRVVEVVEGECGRKKR